MQATRDKCGSRWRFFVVLMLTICGGIAASKLPGQDSAPADPAAKSPGNLPQGITSAPAEESSSPGVVIDSTPDIGRSENVQKAVEVLEERGAARRMKIQREGKPVALEAILAPRHDAPLESIVKLIEVLKSLGIERIAFSVLPGAKNATNSVIVQCPADITWRRVRTITETLTKLELAEFRVDVRVAANNEPVTPTRFAIPSDSGYLPPAPPVPTPPGGVEPQDPQAPQNPNGLSAPRPGESRVPSKQLTPDATMKVFMLQHVNAADAGRIIEQLYQNRQQGSASTIGIAVDTRTNSLILRGPATELAEIEALLLRLDEPARGNSPPAPETAGQILNRIAPDGESTNQRRAQYERLDQETHALAEQLRAPLPDSASGERLRKVLRDTVQQAFVARQQLQRAELAEFARRLKDIQQSIEMRDKIREQIIDRRVSELLDPNLKWGYPASTTRGTLSHFNKRADKDVKETGSAEYGTAPRTATEGAIPPAGETAKSDEFPYRPQNEVEAAVGKLVLVFFQDESRRAVPCLVLKVGGQCFALTTGPAAVVPDGSPPAIDNVFVEWDDKAPVRAVYDSRSTRELIAYRISAGITTASLGEVANVQAGNVLSALCRKNVDRLESLDARVVNVDVVRDFRLPERNLDFRFAGLIEVNRSLPEGTPLFLDGKLAGLTLLGTRFLGETSETSYLVPAERLVGLCKQLQPRAAELGVEF